MEKVNQDNHYKKVSNSERFYQVCEKISSPFCLQMMIEGNGDLSIEDLTKAVKEVSNVNQGTRLVLKKIGYKKYWIDSGITPSVKLADESFFEDFENSKTIINGSKNPYLYNKLDLEKGSTCEVYLIKGKVTRVLFRASHAVMDARGLLFWSEEVFRYLNNKPLLGTNTRISDIDYYKTFDQKSKVKKVPLTSRSPSPLGKTHGDENTPIWARKKIYGNYPTLVSQLTYLLSQESYKHSSKPVSFMITADMRNKENNLQTTGNLSSPIYLNITKENSWIDIYKQIINSFKENIDKQVDKSEDLVHFIPVNLLSKILSNYLKKLSKKDSYLFSVAISNLGKIYPENFSVGNFKCSNVIFLPMDLPGFSISLITVETPDFIELLLSAPSFIANNGRLEKLMDYLELGLKELNKIPSLKSNIANDEEKRQIEQFNNTNTIYPKDKTVIDLFQEQVNLNPNNIAISMDKKSITFKELDKQSNSFANNLIKFGIGKGTIIALLTRHSIETIISILGILKSGNAYLPIDPEHPPERILFMLEDSNVSCLITNLNKIDYFPNDKIIFLNDNIFDSESEVFSNKQNDLAYIMYTSGSTGKPKGVKVTNLNLINYILWVKKYGLLENEKTIYPFYTSLSFDLTITSIFLPLISGNQIEVYKNEDHKFAIKKIIEDKKANVIKLTPTHLKLMKEFSQNTCNIKKIITLGEALSTDLAREMHNRLNIEIINQYGPTEATVGCMVHKFNPNQDIGSSVPIGVPGDNTYIYLLNDNLEEVSIGGIGEIYISGDCVAKGYLNRDELTKEKFLSDPFKKDQIMYRTGDLGLRLDNFEIEYLERADEQVKFRGFRIELGEIESLLLKYKEIQECVVLLKEKKNNDISDTLKYLVAYYKSNNEIDIRNLKDFLSNNLPYYMIPSNYVHIKEIPLTVNGKVNKKLLLNIDENEINFNSNYLDSEQDEITKKVKSSISKVISISENKINQNVNLFDLGIDSLSFTLLFSIITKELLPIEKNNYLIENIDKILINPTVKNLVELIKKA